MSDDVVRNEALPESASEARELEALLTTVRTLEENNAKLVKALKKLFDAQLAADSDKFAAAKHAADVLRSVGVPV